MWVASGIIDTAHSGMLSDIGVRLAARFVIIATVLAVCGVNDVQPSQ
jgi:hypothetical protein